MTSTVELLPPAEAVPSNSKWHELRRAGVTASDIAAILGLSPWESPFSAYWRKVNGWEIDDNPDMDAGRRLEPVIADWFADLHVDHLDVRAAGLYTHPDRPWQLATPDRLCYSTHWVPGADLPGMPDWDGLEAVLDCKHPYNWEDFGDDGSDEIPVYYRAQLQWQMDVLCVDRGYLAAYANHQLRVYPLRRDDADLAVMRNAAWQFLQRIEVGDPPDVDSHTATVVTLKKLHPSVRDIDVAVPVALAEGYRRARALKSRAEQAVDGFEARIRAALSDGHRAVCGGKLVASRSVYDRKPYHVGPATIDKLTPGRATTYV